MIEAISQQICVRMPFPVVNPVGPELPIMIFKLVDLGPNSIEKNPTEKPTENPTEKPTEIPYTKKKSKNG